MHLKSDFEFPIRQRVAYHNDYPHPDGTWPWGLEQIGKQPIPEESKRRILWDNPARAFRLSS